MRQLTSRQREVLGFMRSFQAKHGVPPTVRELGRRQDSAQPNDIVVAMVESEAGGETEATVKRFLRDGSRVVLKPENQTMAPIVVDPARRAVTILGKVIGLLRGF